MTPRNNQARKKEKALLEQKAHRQAGRWRLSPLAYRKIQRVKLSTRKRQADRARKCKQADQKISALKEIYQKPPRSPAQSAR